MKTDMKQQHLAQTGRITAGAYYDFQHLRLESMNRIRDVIYHAREDVPYEKPQEKKEKTYSNDYKDGNLEKLLDELMDSDKISEGEYDYLKKTLETIKSTAKIENQYKKLMMQYIQTETVYEEFLSKIRGLGPILSANLLYNFGYCEKFDTVSKLWKYCGYDVGEDGKAPKKKRGETIHWNPKAKTLVWKITDSLMKQNTPLYRGLYDNEKKKQQKKEYEPGVLKEKFNGYTKKDTHLSKGHAHNRALRKMGKIFLQHYWVKARELAGLKTGEPYAIKNLKNHEHYITADDAIAAQNVTGKDTIKYKKKKKKRKKKQPQKA